MATIDDLVVTVRFDVDDGSLTKLRSDTQKATKSIEGNLKKVSSAMKQVAKASAAIGAAFLAAGGAALVMVRNQAKAADQLAKTADRIGLSTEALAGLQYGAKLSGASVETLNMALQRMTRRVSEASFGTGEAVNALKELKLDARELTKLDADEKFARIADALFQVEDESRRVALQMKLMDSEAVVLLNMMQRGSKGIAEYRKEAEELGLTLSRADASAVEAANDAMTRMGLSITGAARIAAVELAPTLEGVSNAIIDISKEGGALRKVIGSLVENLVAFGIAGVGALDNVINLIQDGQKGFLIMGKYAVQSAHNAVTGFKSIVGIIKNFDKLLVPIGEAIIAVFENPFDALKLSIANILEFVVTQILSISRTFTDLGYRINDTLGESLGNVESHLTGVVGHVSKFKQGIVEGSSSAAALQQSFAKIGETMSNVTVGESGLEGLIAGFDDALATVDERLPSKLQETLVNAINIAKAAVAEKMAESEANGEKSLPQMMLGTADEWTAVAEENQAVVDEFWGKFMQANEQAQDHWTSVWNKGLEQRAAFSKMSTTDQTKHIIGQIEQVTASAAKENKTMFRINKIAAMSSAFVNTAEGVTKSLAAYPAPWNIAMAGITAAAGAAQISAISSRSFSSGGGSSPAPSASSAPSAPQAQSLSADEAATNNAAANGQTTITVEAPDLQKMDPNSMIAAGDAQMILEKVNEGLAQRGEAPVGGTGG